MLFHRPYLRERRPLLLEPEDALDEAYATLGVADVEVVTGTSADENLLLRDGGEFDVWYSASVQQPRLNINTTAIRKTR
jgi:hypothetical protein